MEKFDHLKSFAKTLGVSKQYYNLVGETPKRPNRKKNPISKKSLMDENIEKKDLRSALNKRNEIESALSQKSQKIEDVIKNHSWQKDEDILFRSKLKKLEDGYKAYLNEYNDNEKNIIAAKHAKSQNGLEDIFSTENLSSHQLNKKDSSDLEKTEDSRYSATLEEAIGETKVSNNLVENLIGLLDKKKKNFNLSVLKNPNYLSKFKNAMKKI